MKLTKALTVIALLMIASAVTPAQMAAPQCCVGGSDTWYWTTTEVWAGPIFGWFTIPQLVHEWTAADCSGCPW